MIGFLIRKNFYDQWDNLFRVALLNLGFVIILAFPVALPSLLVSIPVLGLSTLIIGIFLCFIYLSAAALSVSVISDYGSFGFADFFRNLKIMWPAGIALGAITIAAYFLLTVVIPFYLSMQSLLGVLLAAVIFWALLVCLLSLQFFFAIRCRLDTKLSKVFKKCFIIFFDNPLFSIFTLIHSIVCLGVSVFLAFLFPGPAGVILFTDEALRLRLLKYDWLEANPEGDRKKIPWDALLIDERERTGTRSLRNIIFPWKD